MDGVDNSALTPERRYELDELNSEAVIAKLVEADVTDSKVSAAAPREAKKKRSIVPSDDGAGESKRMSMTAQIKKAKMNGVAIAALVGNVFDWPGSRASSHLYAYETRESLMARKDLGEFIRISDWEIARYWRSSETGRNESIACNLLLDVLLSASIVFEQESSVTSAIDQQMREAGMSAIASSILDSGEERDRCMSTVWCALVRSISRSLWEMGFVALAYFPHPVIGFAPAVVDLTKVEVYYHSNVVGQHSFVYRRKPSYGLAGASPWSGNGGGPIARALGSGDFGDASGFLPGIMTFVWEAPLRGRISSKIVRCFDRRDEIMRRKRLRDIAEVELSLPSFYTEKDSKPYSEEGVGLDADSVAERMEAASDQLDQINSAIARRMSRLPQDGIGPMWKGTGVDAMKANLERSAARRIDLPEGRKYVAPAMPVIPQGIDEAEAQYQVEVMQEFGIPPSVTIPDKGHGHAASVEAANSRLTMTQDRLRADMLAILYDLYHALYDEPQLLYYLSATPPWRQSTDGARRALSVRILMPGTPPALEMKELYAMGVITPDCYKRHLKQRLNLYDSDFMSVAKPPMTEYIPPAAPKKPAAKKKKKAKAK